MSEDPLETAKRKGRLAREDGRPLGDCPYGDTRTPRGQGGIERWYRQAWIDGWYQANDFMNRNPK